MASLVDQHDDQDDQEDQQQEPEPPVATEEEAAAPRRSHPQEKLDHSVNLRGHYRAGMTIVEHDEHGRPELPFTADESETLLGFLDYQRATLAWKAQGLTDEELRATLPPTDMSLGGLLKHLARVEDHWFTATVGEQDAVEPWASMRWAAEWQDAGADTGESLRRLWAQRVDASRAVVADRLAAGGDALARTYPAWGGRGRVSLRWVLVHMIEEYARHNGHADLLRQSIDGSTGE